MRHPILQSCFNPTPILIESCDNPLPILTQSRPIVYYQTIQYQSIQSIDNPKKIQKIKKKRCQCIILVQSRTIQYNPCSFLESLHCHLIELGL